MANITIQLVATHPVLKQTILDITKMKREQGDNTPLFEAPINPNSPEGKTWRKGVKIGEAWYNQAGWSLDTEDGQPTGGISISLKSNDSQSSSGGGNKGSNFGGYKKSFQKSASYGNNRQSRY